MLPWQLADGPALYVPMDRLAFREAMRKGGQVHAKSLTASERKRIATKASKAAVRARTAQARVKAKKQKPWA